MTRPEARVASVTAAAYTIPTDAPESDGTLSWDATTLVVVEVEAGGAVGLGYTYSHPTAAEFVTRQLAALIEGRDAMAPEAAWWAMVHAVRNIGRQGLVACAISAVDVALWDLKAKLLGVSLVDLLGPVHETVLVYGSGGFTSYDDARLREQLAGWAEQGCRMVKMKIGRDAKADRRRVAVAREAIGDDVGLFVDANGAYTPSEALGALRWLDAHGVGWFEEPVTSDDLEGMRRLRDRAPGGLAITSGEYGWDPWVLERMLAAGAVDVLQADASRCGGVTAFRKVGALCEARNVPLSAHTAPGLHLHVGCSLAGLIHLEYFHDHVRIERTLFDGLAPLEKTGRLRPDRSRSGHGLTLLREAAEKYRVA